MTLLRASGVEAQGDSARGYDHGVFVPLTLMYARADVPVIQVCV